MWPKNTRPAIEPHEITAMPGRPGKNRRKDSDEPVKKKFGKVTRKGRKMMCSVCKTFGHNKKGCPTLISYALIAAIAGISSATAGTSDATAESNAATSDLTNAAIGSQSSVNAGPNVGPSARRPTNASSSETKTKKEEAKTTGYGLLFGSGGSVTERSGNIDKVLYSATLSSSTPTIIDLGYKLNGLRWKGGVAVTQRQLREDSYRSTQGTTNTHATSNTQGTHSISLCLA
ncbi:hypothetical protein KY290_028328 [Solanum tuberosum]|uniref:Uncharacterized protein n=1 Tax=Solanum tuberosum TaxID=4113 RepID=A0ABQ7UHK6_SOLTU|nr:hypothetical protein KY290_028328 [Solanum tuberosum]